MFRSVRRELISHIKKIAIENIPKAKLIWRIIRFKPSKKQQKDQSTLDILKRIEIVNFAYLLLKTMKTHDRHLNKEVWSATEITLLEEVRQAPLRFMEQGRENDIFESELKRLGKVRGILEKEIDRFRTSKNNVLTVYFERWLEDFDLQTGKLSPMSREEFKNIVWSQLEKASFLMQMD